MIIILQYLPNLYVSRLPRESDCQGEQKDNHLSVKKSVEAGFSLIELLIVILILMIMTAVAIFPFIAHRNAYRTEDQALQLVNFLEEAKMRSLANHRAMRFEIDLTAKVLRLIDENSGTAGSADDFIVKEENLVENVHFNPLATNLTGIFPNVSVSATPLYYSPATYGASSHPLSTKNGAGNTVWTARFLSDGRATTPFGCSSVECPGNVTIFMWMVDAGNANIANPVQSVRAVTVFGETSNVRLWQYDGTNFEEW